MSSKTQEKESYVDKIKLKKTLLFGYSKKSVHLIQQKWMENKKAFEQQLKDKDSIIEKMQQEILSYRQKEELILESIVEAKDLAKGIVSDAEKNAEQLKKEAFDKLDQQVVEFEGVMQRLNHLKQEIISQEKGLKMELVDVMTKYMHQLENIDMSEFTSSTQSLRHADQIQQELVQSAKNISKKIVVLPKRQLANQENDMPVYTFKK